MQTSIQAKQHTDREEVPSNTFLPQRYYQKKQYFHNTYLLMLGMSKALYAVDRATLLKNLKTVLDSDELHLIKIMLNTELIVRCETEERNFFKTDIGVLQGDILSTNEFTLHLVTALYKGNNDHICKKSRIITSSELSSISKHDHRKDIDEHFSIYQQYANDISTITSDKNKIDHIKKDCSFRIINLNSLSERNKNQRI